MEFNSIVTIDFGGIGTDGLFIKDDFENDVANIMDDNVDHIVEE